MVGPSVSNPGGILHLASMWLSFFGSAVDSPEGMTHLEATSLMKDLSSFHSPQWSYLCYGVHRSAAVKCWQWRGQGLELERDCEESTSGLLSSPFPPSLAVHFLTSAVFKMPFLAFHFRVAKKLGVGGHLTGKA